ncbi:two-component response regulator-like APRR5 [Impatiens glandulifera]|uniref:two-component response regulator-like APRR5 n=1 Tax=Impatiens glandulifera TaxID=253017 RepID=UPI001FB10B9B|nr:two-component response regulator-like APRR5 [Impatiens glandulifera]
MEEGPLSSGDDAINLDVDKKGGVTVPMMRWGRFLPRIVLRVLLVEADDSTRQIIAALLRKCSYKVTAVTDGLEAWEVLKGKSPKIDLILTEVDLPSISGFALLTLIMEHEICKTIPVIMMSSQDSVRMVYKCMLRGAADFLVKPLRKNELRNLWQHVWRRQNFTNSGQGAQDESVAQQRVEAGAESNDASNDSSSVYIATDQKIREHVEKGSYAQVDFIFDETCFCNQLIFLIVLNLVFSVDCMCLYLSWSLHVLQSSSTKPDIEVDDTFPRITHELRKYDLDYVGLLKNEEVSPSNKNLKILDACPGQLVRTLPNQWGRLAQRPTGMTPNFNQGVEVAGSKKDKIMINDEKPESHLQNNVEVFATNPLSAAILPLKEAVDLIGAFGDFSNSICRSISPPRDYITDGVEDYLKLDLSLRGSCASVSVNQVITTVEKQRLNHSDSSAFSRYINKKYDRIESLSRKVVDETVFDGPGQWKGEISFPGPHHQQKAILTVPVPFRTIRVDNSSFKMNPLFEQSNIERRNSQKLCSSSRTEQQVLNNNSEKNKCSSDNKQQYFDQIPAPGHWVSAENGNDRILQQRSIQREAALNKFRMKRKERCYEKKVRYESRKKLAEQRPRVKGQFVRQEALLLLEETNSTELGNSDDS